MNRVDRYPYTLAQLQLFAGCSRTDLDLAGSLLTTVVVEPGDVIMREGSSPTQAFIVETGALHVTTRSDGETRSLGVAVGGEPLGEMSLLHGTPRNATVTAVTRTTLHVATPREFMSLIAAMPAFSQRVSDIAVRRREQNNAA